MDAIKVLIVPTHKDHTFVHVNQGIMETEKLVLKMMHVLAIDVVQWDCVSIFLLITYASATMVISKVLVMGWVLAWT